MKKTVIVTGGCGGLGMEFVKSHLESGDKVYAYDLKLTPDFEKLMKANNNLFFRECNVGKMQSVSEALTDFIKAESTLDILYHTVGIYRFEDKVYLPDSDLDSMGSMFNINAVGFLRVMKALWNYFKDTAVICITSEAGSIGNNFRNWEYEYCMSKCAENMAAAIVQHHFNELKNGSRIMCLHPGWLRTAMGGEEAFKHPEMSVDPVDSAKCIREIAENIHSFPAEVMYMDYAQNILKW